MLRLSLWVFVGLALTACTELAPATGSFGDPCTSNTDCSSGLCLLGAGDFCTDPCSTDCSCICTLPQASSVSRRSAKRSSQP